MANVIVRRKEWNRGQSASTRLVDTDGNFCILGFIGEQVYNLDKTYMGNYTTLGSALSGVDTEAESEVLEGNWQVDMFSINDDTKINRAEKEELLTKKAKERGIDLTFVGRSPKGV